MKFFEKNHVNKSKKHPFHMLDHAKKMDAKGVRNLGHIKYYIYSPIHFIHTRNFQINYRTWRKSILKFRNITFAFRLHRFSVYRWLYVKNKPDSRIFDITHNGMHALIIVLVRPKKYSWCWLEENDKEKTITERQLK